MLWHLRNCMLRKLKSCKNDQTHLLKRECHRAKRLWRKSKLKIHQRSFIKSICVYSKALCRERQAYFSEIINDSGNNPIDGYFPTTDRLLNPSQHSELICHDSQSKYEKFASLFENKISNIRASIVNNFNKISQVPTRYISATNCASKYCNY